MAFQNKQFVFGKDKIPTWFNEEAGKGRAKFNYDDDNDDVVSVTVYTPTQTLIAKPGDVIMLLKSGLAVITGDKAKKYGVIKTVERKEES